MGELQGLIPRPVSPPLPKRILVPRSPDEVDVLLQRQVNRGRGALPGSQGQFRLVIEGSWLSAKVEPVLRPEKPQWNCRPSHWRHGKWMLRLDAKAQ
jgi:hypothetical protein